MARLGYARVGSAEFIINRSNGAPSVEDGITLLVPDDSLLHFSLAKISFIYQNKTSFIGDMCCHLKLCSHLFEPNKNLERQEPQSVETF